MIPTFAIAWLQNVLKYTLQANSIQIVVSLMSIQWTTATDC